MTVATVRATMLAALVAVTGVENVDVEEPLGRDPDAAMPERMVGDAPHFWLVRVNTLASGGGAGYTEPRRRVRIDGYLGLDIGDAALSSYVQAANLEASVEAAIRSPSFALDVESIAPDGEIPVVDVQIGDRAYTCHHIGLTAVIIEVT